MSQHPALAAGTPATPPVAGAPVVRVLTGRLSGAWAPPAEGLQRPPGWNALRQLVLGRILVASLALPSGLLLRPDATSRPLAVLALALGAIAGVSIAWTLGGRLARGLRVQTAAQLGVDLMLVTWLAAYTGGRGSQFVLFYALVVITGGVLGRVGGGLLAAGGACAGFLALPALAAPLGGSDFAGDALIKPELMVTFLTIVGVLAGVLGERVQRTAGDLERTERELDRVKLDNDAILRHLATGVLTVDETGAIGYLNPAAAQVLGVRAEDLCGRPVEQAFPARLDSLRELVQDSRDQGRGRARAELTVTTANGRTLPLGASTNVLRHEDKLTGVVAVFQDLTEVREMERRARRNETLAEVGALAAGIAHELRNGLKPISGSVEVLQRELKLEGETADLMDLIARESARLNKFVTDLLSYSRERDLALEPVKLDDHLRELVSTLRHDPRRAAGVQVDYVGCQGPAEAPEEARLAVDPEQMRQVWLNLAANALEAIGERGTLTVSWSVRDEDQVAVEFRDDGPGIDADDLRRVGEPFFTTKRGGTGLGLAIALRIVERHGGGLTLESVAGRGTTARVTLPGLQVPAAQAA
jgi:two-component system sensor histidine kinase PilS (NtrC family)